MQVWYINLERRRDRKVSIEENFRASGVPRGCVNRFNGTDRNAFDSPESLVESLVHDGFPEFERGPRISVAVPIPGLHGIVPAGVAGD